MAQEVAIKLNFDAGNSVKEIEKIDNVLKDIKTNTNIDNVNQQFQKLNATIDKGGNSAEDLQRAVKSYQTIALTAGRTSPIGQEALKRAANLKDQLVDLDNEVKRLANDHQQLQGAMEIGSTVIGGYSAFQGVTAMLGAENEELMQTMVKLQGAQSALNGVMQIKMALEKESNAMILLQSLRTKALTAVQLAYATVIGTTTGALKLLRMALIATGLGAIVVLIGTLVANWDKWKDSIMSFINNALTPLRPMLEWLGIIESENDKIRREAHENRVNQLKEELKLIQNREKIITEHYDHEIAKARASGKETFELEKQKLEAVRDRAIKEGQILLQLGRLNKDLNEEEIKEMTERANALAEILASSKKDLEILEITHNKKIEDEAKKHSDKLVSIKQKEEEQKLALKQRFEDLAISIIEDDAQRELMALDLKHQREMEKLIQQYGEKTELISQLERVQEQERINAINEIQEAQKLKDDEALEEKKKKESTYQQFVKDMFQKTSEEIVLKAEQRDEAIAQSKEALFSATQSAVSGLISLMGQQSKAGKALALTQIAIDTAVGFANGLRIAQQGAIASGPAAPYAFPIFYATQIGAVLNAIGKAKSILNAGSQVSAPSTSIASGGYSSLSRTSNAQGIDTGNNTDRTNNGTTDFVDNRVVLVESEVNAMRMRANQINVLASI